jgi:hypothetical protein
MKKLLGMILVLTMVLSVFSVSLVIDNFDDNTKNALERSINSGNASAADYAAMSLAIMSEYNFEALYNEAEMLLDELDEESLNEDITQENLEEMYNVEGMKEFMSYMRESGGIKAMKDISDYLEHVMGKYETRVNLSEDAVRNLLLNIGMDQDDVDNIQSQDNYPEYVESDYRDFLVMKIMSEVVLMMDANSDMYFDTLEDMEDLIGDPMASLKPEARKVIEKYNEKWSQTSPNFMEFDTVLQDIAIVDGDTEWASLSDLFTDETLFFEYNSEMLVNMKDILGYVLDMSDFEATYYTEDRDYLNLTDIMFSEVRDEMEDESTFELRARIATDFMRENLSEELSEENLTTTIYINGEEVYTIISILEGVYDSLPYGEFNMNMSLSTWDPTLQGLGMEEFGVEIEVGIDFDSVKDGYNLNDLNIELRPGVVMNALNLVSYLGSASSEQLMTMLNTVIDDIGFLYNEDQDLVMKMGEDDYFVSMRVKDILNIQFIETLIQSMNQPQQY